MAVLSNKLKCGKQSKIRKVGVRVRKSSAVMLFFFGHTVAYALYPSRTDTVCVCMFACLWVKVSCSELEVLRTCFLFFVLCGLRLCHHDFLHLFMLLSYLQWTREPPQPMFTHRHSLMLEFLYRSQTCLRRILFPVACAGRSVCWREQAHFRGISPLYWDPNTRSSQKGLLNTSHSALLRNKNWFGSQWALATCEGGPCGMHGLLYQYTVAMYNALLHSWLLTRLFARCFLFTIQAFLLCKIFSLS